MFFEFSFCCFWPSLAPYRQKPFLAFTEVLEKIRREVTRKSRGPRNKGRVKALKGSSVAASEFDGRFNSSTLIASTIRQRLRLFLSGQFLKTRIAADLVPHRIESQQRRSNRTQSHILTGDLQQPVENGNRVIGVPQ
jgi:hypothetical protein